MQETKIKALEEDITRMKRTKEQIESKMRVETERFSKFKQTVARELTSAKREVNQKGKEVLRLKQDLKKTD